MHIYRAKCLAPLKLTVLLRPCMEKSRQGCHAQIGYQTVLGIMHYLLLFTNKPVAAHSLEVTKSFYFCFVTVRDVTYDICKIQMLLENLKLSCSRMGRTE